MTTNTSEPKRARFSRLGTIESQYGIGRTALYQYAKRGWLRLIHLRPPGVKRGITLVDLDELEAMIEGFRRKPEVVL